MIHALVLSLATYAGRVPVANTPGSRAFSVTVVGSAGQSVRVRALDVPDGYIASFCTDRVCAPFAVTFALPTSGRRSIELAVIPIAHHARPPAVVSVAAAGARTVSIPFSRGADRNKPVRSLIP